jgi:hypothetical protein
MPSIRQAFIAGGDERGQLVVEPLPRRRSIHEPKVHRGQTCNTERREVLLDAGPQLVWFVVGQDRTDVVTARGYLAHDR